MSCSTLKKQDCLDNKSCNWVVGKGCKSVEGKRRGRSPSPKRRSASRSASPKPKPKRSTSPKKVKGLFTSAELSELLEMQIITGAEGKHFKLTKDAKNDINWVLINLLEKTFSEIEQKKINEDDIYHLHLFGASYVIQEYARIAIEKNNCIIKRDAFKKRLRFVNARGEVIKFTTEATRDLQILMEYMLAEICEAACNDANKSASASTKIVLVSGGNVGNAIKNDEDLVLALFTDPKTLIDYNHIGTNIKNYVRL